jgi:diacylglycerol kinase (ATP)
MTLSRAAAKSSRKSKPTRKTGIARIVDATFNSLRGFQHAFVNEAAFREEAIVLALALPLGWFIAPTPVWYLAMIGSILLLMAVELLNTGIEKLSDHVTPSYHRQIGAIKDYGSAAVFCAIAFSGLIWMMAFAIRFGLI